MMFHEAYKRIWLQVDPDGDAPIGSEYPLCEGATWCQDKINNNDVEYVREDEVEALRAEIAALTKERDEAIYQTKVATQEHADMEQELAAAQAYNAWLRSLLLTVPEEHLCVSVQKALATPLDDSALQERLKEEREKCAERVDDREMFGGAATVIRSMT